jgi:signal transduction histidine kinase/ligand-binding sensor domain-containing protein
MNGTRQRGLHVAAAVCVLLSGSPCAFALNSALDVSQYAHAAWKIRDGFTKGTINSIAQTPDGYLWLGTDFGLVRFDGVQTVSWTPPAGEQLPNNNIRRLLVSRDGTLWMGTREGLASWSGGKLAQYPELAGLIVSALTEGHAGTIWAGGRTISGLTGKICSIQKSSVRCDEEMGGVGLPVISLHEDRNGNLWAGLLTGMLRYNPGPPQFFPVPGEPNGVRSMVDDENGALLVAVTGGVRRLVDGKLRTADPFPAALRGVLSTRLLRDHDGGLWVGTIRGIVHVHGGRTDVFSQSDGLSGDSTSGFFEDREGTIWVNTINGLDRFREFPVVTYSVNQGFSNPSGAFLGARDGSIWFATSDGLSRLDHGQIAMYRERGGPAMTGGRTIAGSGLPDHGLASLFEDSRGRIWVSSFTGVGYLENDRYVSTTVPGGVVLGFTEDREGNLWIANQELGLFRLSPDNKVEQTPWVAFGQKNPASSLASDPAQGGLWLGLFSSGLVYFRDGQVRASYSTSQGLGKGAVTDLRFDRQGALWAATEGGLSRLKNGRIDTLTSKNGLPCDAVHWVMEDDANAVWLNMPCGLVRVARSELGAWAAAPNKSGRRIESRVFESSDGIRNSATAGGFTPHVAKSSDGKLWFHGVDGISVVDPSHLPFNKLPPPVHIEQITADRKQYDPSARLPLPALTRDLEIDYTALSLVAPEKIRFRYKLEGHDRDWQDAGNRRQAFYNDLLPRNYRFRVMASNNSGVWNEAGASFDFSIDPAYYQMIWFRLSCAAAFLALLAALYHLRLRYLKHEFNIRLEARVGERTRIARDLHDTLLQSFQGVLLKFSALQYLIQDRPTEAEETLERLVEQAGQAITEGRDAVQGLRSSTVVANDLARAIGTFGEGLAADHTGANCPEFRVRVAGNSKNLPPLVRDEIYQIGCETLRNAFRHAQATRIEVELRYDPREFRLCVRDNGKGIDPAVLSAGGRAGHHGLPGIHERAGLAGGKLSVWSRLDSGTEIELTIPGSIAYTKSPADRRSMNAGEGTG